MNGQLRALPFSWGVFLLLSCISLGLAADNSEQTALVPEANGAADHAELIARWIKQLGSDEYVEREQAEALLLELGAEAIDALQAAEHHTDLEISSRANYILQRIRVSWIREDDPAEVRRLLERYGELTYSERSNRIEQLAALKERNGLGALCRIVRYEPSPVLARVAALAILQQAVAEKDSSRDLATMAQELGNGERVPIEWLRTYFEQIREPEFFNPNWILLIDDELKRLAQLSEETDRSIVEQFLDYQLATAAMYAEAAPIFEILRRKVDLPLEERNTRAAYLAEGMSWILDQQKWRVLDLFEAHYAAAIRNERLLVYLSATARLRQGKNKEAEEFAKRAFLLQKGKPAQRKGIADALAELGCHDWAEREWNYVVDNLPVMDGNSILARRQIANWRLHDRGDDEAAAKLLADFFNALDANPALKKQIMANRSSRSNLQEIQAEKEFFLACHAENEGNYAEQRRHLDAAIKLDDKNADVLIAMYHLKDADDEYHSRVRKLIKKTCNYVENRIQQTPNAPHWYNHWAWLVSNTEGNYDRAVEFSLRSLELSPQSPSYLDTLGRCYYAAGDLENAIQSQQQAVDLHPQVLTMRRQLEFFQKELAARKDR